MNAIRKILTPLLLIPLGMLFYVSIYPDWQWETPGLEYLFAGIGIPIVAVNFIAWFYPDILKAYFPVKDTWGQRGNGLVTLAAVLSALIALTCVGVGAVSAVANAAARPIAEPFAVGPITATAFARSIQALASGTEPGEVSTFSTARPSPEASLLPGQTEIPEATPQIPVSGGTGTEPPVLSVIPTESEAAFAKPVGPTSTPVRLTSTPVGPTGTAVPLGSCTRAAPQYQAALGQSVQDTDPENVLQAGWMAKSNMAPNLWFVAGRVQSETETMGPGVWGLFVYEDGSLDIYAINDVAMDTTYEATGDDSDPVLTMQSDGAQAAYDCAVHGQ